VILHPRCTRNARSGEGLPQRGLLAGRKILANLGLASGHSLVRVEGRVVRGRGFQQIDPGGDALLGPLLSVVASQKPCGKHPPLPQPSMEGCPFWVTSSVPSLLKSMNIRD